MAITNPYLDIVGEHLSARATPYSEVVVRDPNNVVIGHGSANARGEVFITLIVPQRNGETVRVSELDSTGVEVSFGLTTAPDITPPNPAQNLAFNNDLTIITGQGEPGSTVRIQDDGGDIIYRGPVDNLGNFTATLPRPARPGEEFYIMLEDPAGNINNPVTLVAPICFARGTLILTDRGEVAVEHLAPGDMVMTLDHGPQPLRWIGQMQLGAEVLARAPQFRPIRIRAGALGQGIPPQDLSVSPQHRMLVRSAIARRMFDSDEILVAARQLLGLDGIEVVDTETVEYFHLLFDRHEIVTANGAPAESLYLGAEAHKSLSPAALAELELLFPELFAGVDTFAPARPFATGRRVRALAERHGQNSKPLVA